MKSPNGGIGDPVEHYNQ